MSVSELNQRLEKGPDFTIPAHDLPTLLKDAPWPNPQYPRYRDWVVGQVWERFATNLGRRRAPYGWRDDPEYDSCQCWLYVELALPNLGRSLQKPIEDEDHDHIVHVFVIKGDQVLAAVRIDPWRGTGDLWDMGWQQQQRQKSASPAGR